MTDRHTSSHPQCSQVRSPKFEGMYEPHTRFNLYLRKQKRKKKPQSGLWTEEREGVGEKWERGDQVVERGKEKKKSRSRWGGGTLDCSQTDFDRGQGGMCVLIGLTPKIPDSQPCHNLPRWLRLQVSCSTASFTCKARQDIIPKQSIAATTCAHSQPLPPQQKGGDL